MRKILDRLTALVMVMLMFIQTCVPAITSFAKEEELDKRYVIQKLESLKQDTYANFSLNLATILDDKNLDTDTNVKFILNATSTDSNIKLLVRKDFSLYDERTFDKVEDAYKEFDRIDKSLKDQGLSLDVSVVQDGEKYRIKNNYVPQAGKEDFGSDYKVYSLKVIDKFDFEKQGLYNKLPENDKLSAEHNLQIAEQRRLQQDGEVPEPGKHNVTYIFNFKVDKSVDPAITTIALNKDANNPLEVKQNADLFAAILNDKTYSVYQTEQLPAEVTSSIEHKKEVAKKKAEADAKAKAEADAKAKAEADAKAKKEADEKAKKEADEKAKKEADEKAKKEADEKAKQEADKKKSEEAKKAQEQKTAEEKAKAEADAKAKAEAEAKAKAEAEKLAAAEKAKQEQLAKEQKEAEAKRAAEEKVKKDLENKKLLGLVKDTEEKQEEEPIIKKKEIKEEVKSEPATPQERKQKAEEFDKALQDRKEEIKKSEDKKDANNKEDNKKTTDQKEVSKETKGLLEGIKEFFGFSNLQKADRELKAILSVKANGLKEVQALLSSFEDKYHLTQQEQAKLMDDNKDAIKALIERDADKNFRPQVFAANPVGAGTSTLTEAEKQNLANKKFHVMTIFQTSNAAGAIQDYQYFKIHLDDELMVNDSTSLKDIKDKNGNVIAKPTYDKGTNIITYNIEGTIPENISVPLDIPVDFNPDKINLESDGTFTVINKVSGLGIVNPPKDLVPQRIDKNGSPAGSIIETGRHDVIQIFDNEHDRTYSVNVDAHGKPAVENGKINGINWTVKVHSTDDLKNLGFRLNLTAVEGSGLEVIKDVKLNGQEVELTKQLENATGIVDSKHHNLQTNATDLLYTFFTPVERVQSAYMLDVSGILTKKNNILGAARLVLDDVYKADAISEATPTRVGMNNRTTIQGKFKSANEAEWTVTDQVSSGDEKEPNANKGLPLKTRELEGSQEFKSGKSVVYGIDTDSNSPTYGKMVVKRSENTITAVPEKEKDPEGAQAVGNIAVYKIDTKLTDATSDENTAKDYRLSGVSLSKYKDVIVEQEWNLPEGKKMPGQKIEVIDKETGEAIASKEVGEEKGKSRTITIPNVKFWDFKEENGKQVYVANKLGIKQNLPKDTFESSGQKYKYSENSNYYKEDTKTYLIRNSAVKDGNTLTSFTVIKIDKNKDKDGKDIKLEGADYYLLGTGVGITTDKNGEATFRNIGPGNYVLKETKAPNGYKLDQETKNVTITESGEIVVTGNNAVLTTGSSKTQMVEHSNYPNWPDFMNAMHYGKIDQNGNVEFYVYLKPRAKQAGGSTDKDTDLNITLPGVSLTDANVTAYDVHPYYRDQVRQAMVAQDLSSVNNITSGSNLINDTRNKKVITGKTIQTANPGETGYQIYFPKERFADDWGFLVKVTGNIGDKNSTNLSYDWIVHNSPQDSNIRQNVTLNKNANKDDIPTITITNEAFKQSEIKISKFANEFDKDGKRVRVPNAEFVLKDSNDNVLANKLTDADGNVNFGSHIPGTYTIEEINAPDGYLKSNVYYEVTVDESNKVTYKPKFKTGSGQPVIGEDYWIEKGTETQKTEKPNVTYVSQRLEYNEGGADKWGTKANVWEAYMFESLKYHADITISDGTPGKRFEIQFDPNLDFTQYFSGFPKIRKGGKDIAEPYFDYKTNLLTYVFNKNSKPEQTIVSIDLKGMIPDKYYFQNSGTKPFTITVAPGQQERVEGQQSITKDIVGDYGRYDTGWNQPSQSYYFRDIYKGDDGQWYVTAMAYFNPMADSRTSKTLKFNWMSTNYDKNTRIARQEGKGYKPAYDLVDVKVYRTEPNMGKIKVDNDVITVNYNMPLSYGIRPEQDPSTYALLYHTGIKPTQKTSSSANGVSLEYDPGKIKTTGGVHTTFPLTVRMPNISPQKEGFIVEQTFKITDINNFINLSRIFYMNNGANSDAGGMESAFANSANFNTAKADQTGEEIPKYYEEITGLINKKYTQGEFKITKLDEADRTKKLSGAIFVLKPEDGNPIYRTSNTNGEISFTGLAPGRYILEEFKAPDKHIKTNKQWQVFVFNDGNIRITEAGVSGSTQSYDGKNINIEVTNKPEGQDFVVYKKDDKGNPLPGAKFKLTKHNDTSFKAIEKESDEKGLVKFGQLQNGTYIIEEIAPPSGYKPLDKKWVLVIDEKGKRVYNYREKSGTTNKLNSILEKENVNWVDVGNRSLEGWNLYDNRRADWTANYPTPFKLGTRIVGINNSDPNNSYVIQRYVLNPESLNIGATTATIHREKPEYPNMDWFNGTAQKNVDYQVFELDKAVTGNIEDIRLAEYNPTNITNDVKASADNTRFGEPDRLKLEFPETTKPILVDIKIPYKEFNQGVGTGMDWTENGVTYWKSDYYERVNIIKQAGPVLEQSKGIQGSYISDDSLDVSNELQTYKFTLKKVKEGTTPSAIQGATFKLIGPGESKEERTMTTGSDGTISFDNLKPGTYKLEETQPAPGYEQADHDWTVTVSKDGKTFIRKNGNPPSNSNQTNAKVSVQSNSNIISRYLLNLNAASNIPELDISGNLMDISNPLRAGNGWETVDPNRSNNPTNGANGDSRTKITQIDKKTGKYRQIFLVNLSGRDLTYSKMDFHAQPPTTSVIGEGATKGRNEQYNFKIVSIRPVSKQSTIDNIIYNGNTTFGVKNAKNSMSGTIKRYSAEVNTGYSDQALAIEVEYTYPSSGPIGLGLDFFPYSGGPKAWSAQNYSSVNDINYKTAENLYSITSNSPSNGKLEITKTSGIKQGEQVTITATPNTGYVLESLTVDGKNVSVNDQNQYIYTMPNHNVTVNATFKPKTTQPYNIYTLQSAGEGSGTISAPSTAKEGDVVTVKVTPGSDSELDRIDVLDSSGAFITNVDKTTNTFKMPGKNVNLKPYFKLKPQATEYSITNYSGPEGSVTANPSSSVKGKPISLTVNAAQDYTIDKIWIEDQAGTKIQDVANNTFNMPDKNVVIKATFKRTEFKIETEVEGEGTLTIEGNKTKAEEGEVIVVNVTPNDSNHEIGQVTANGVPVKLENGKYSFKMLANDVKVRATFNKKTYETYSVYAQGNAERGSVTITQISDMNNKKARKGEVVKFRVDPKPSWEVIKANVYVNQVNGGGRVKLDFDGVNGSFVMPADDVTIYAQDYKQETIPKGSYTASAESTINGGYATVSQRINKPGEKVRITLTPYEGFKNTKQSVKYAQGGTPVPVLSDEQGYYFIMPEANVTVSGTFERSNPGQYKVNLGQTQNGRVSASPTSANEGDEITLSAVANQGYVFKGYSVTANGQAVSLKGNKFKMPAGAVTVSANFEYAGIEIPKDKYAEITNKQTGLEFKIYKHDFRDRPLEGATFELYNADEKYNITDKDKASMSGISDANGIVKFIKNGNEVKLTPGYYVLREVTSPQGYKKISADWKIRVYEDKATGAMKAEYKGPENTPTNFVTSDKSNDTSSNGKIKLAGSGIKYASKMTYINTESKTFVQRIYVDTRGYTGKDKVNVKITPVIKREEFDRPMQPPEIGYKGKYGVKTAYRSTYQIAGLTGDPDKTKLNNILSISDLSDPNVSMINTARWRPFDWGFDEDQLNLDKGVYYIDVEGFYDDNITEDKLGNIEMNIDFLTERYFYSQAKDKKGNFYWKKDGSYQSGAAALGGVYAEDVVDSTGKVIHKKGEPTEWGKKLSKDGKYQNWVGKNVTWTDGNDYRTGKIDTPYKLINNQWVKGNDETLAQVTTTIDIKPLYSSNTTNQISQDGMSILNDEETYNVTFSKHGQDDPKEGIDSEEVTKRRLEGAVFKLQEERLGRFIDVPESTVASAFNGYFGFRGLSPGRYRLMEVKAPKGYKPIDGPLLYFTVETIKTNSGKIVHPETGEVVDIKSITIKFSDTDPEAHKLETLQMVGKDGKIVDIKNAKSTDINVETTKIINPHATYPDKEQVLLKELKIVGANDNYNIKDAKIVPGSSGYISLEYDKANGVYQYVPEKSTSEKDGKLVDFVTSATAKNMGKIVNTKPGKGKVKVTKVDQDAKKITDLPEGVKFKLTNISNGTTTIKDVDKNGEILFDELPIGQYKLEEVASPSGYINNHQIWNFTVGGKDLDPYAGEAPQREDNLSDKITLSKSEMTVINPENKDNKQKADGEIHPHLGEVFEFANTFKLDSNTKIKPGDYFVLNLTKNIDLNGIFEDEASNLDMFADGVGTIAKADYNRKEGTITYTFTKYAETYQLAEFSNKLSAFINLNKVKNSDSQETVGFSVNNKTDQQKSIKVVYDSMTSREDDETSFMNLGSKITKFNPETGEFVHYYYINRDKKYIGPSKFIYHSDQNIYNFKITGIDIKDNTKIDDVMPASFGIDEKNTNYEAKELVSLQDLSKGGEPVLTFKEGFKATESYIIKVTGTVKDKNKTAYVGHGKLDRTYKTSGYYLYVNRKDQVYGFGNSTNAKADLSIQAVNPENKIRFLKVDQDGKPLAGASFSLNIQDKDGNWNDYQGGIKQSGDDGIVEFKQLKAGKYQLVETEAPKGYEKISGAILEFEVDANGNIHRSEKANATTDPNKQPVYVDESGSIAIPIVNKKPQKIQFVKVDASEKTTKLEGAEFEVWYKANETDEDYTTKLKVYEKTVDGKAERLVLKEDDNIPTGYKHVEGDKFVTGEDGLVEFNVLDNGYYALKEVKAPKGYIKPRDIVKEFVVKDGKIQTEQYKTEMDVNKTTGFSMANDVFQKSYTTNMTLRFNPNHEDITYVKDKSTITLSDLPLKAEIWDNKFNGKQPISITAYLVDGDNKETTKKTITLDLTKDYDTSYKGSKTIDLYSLVKELENQTAEGDIKSNKTLVLSMTSSLYLDSELDIKSNIVIGDKINEDRTFHIGTKGEDYVDHSYEFTTLGEPELPILIENKKGEYPLTGAMGIIGFLVVGAVMMATAYYKYRRKRRESALS
ncbi:SpaA isopeptide-forming pilin-related protein [Finegoldia magna]|uniref:SpaA isopeptide-forming pilin-related protein n=1 Tax=Finegoldia magna TaxID=1260 RepID=UPI002907BFBF|nr:SpaA isopeptide-forming pilin-related protein [Finegoldia magna]MDU4731102.1 SpaA isopeptide-forming pilin-related protein [Finegoldia magna]